MVLHAQAAVAVVTADRVVSVARLPVGPVGADMAVVVAVVAVPRAPSVSRQGAAEAANRRNSAGKNLMNCKPRLSAGCGSGQVMVKSSGCAAVLR